MPEDKQKDDETSVPDEETADSSTEDKIVGGDAPETDPARDDPAEVSESVDEPEPEAASASTDEPDPATATEPTDADAVETSASEPAAGTTTGSSGGKAADEVFCQSCGATIKEQAEVCPECGVRQGSDSTSEKDPAIAGVASFFIPGAGQIYNGQVGRGVLAFFGVFIVDMILLTLGFLLAFILIGLLFFPLIPVVHVLVAYDAYDQAKKINAGEVQP